MYSAKLSVVVDSYNRGVELDRCLTSVAGLADEIVVCDENSTDNTVNIAKKHNAKIISHSRVPYVELIRNFEISKASGDWILLLDPDEEISPALANKIKEIVNNDKSDYVNIPRKNMVFGKWLRYSRWWPDYNLRLFRKGVVSWTDKIHAEPNKQGNGAEIEAKEELAIVHHHYSSIKQYLDRMDRYTDAQAEMLMSQNYKFDWRDFISKPSSEFFSRFFYGEGYKDGVHGLGISLLQSFSELVVYLKVWEKNKFPEKSVPINELIAQTSKTGKDLHYWQNDAHYKLTGNLLSRVKRKLRI